MKIKSIIMFLILLISMLAPLAIGASSVVFSEIEVNDIEVTAGGRVAIDRGEDLDIRVELFSPVDYEDVRVEASVEGYEYDEIEDETKIFDMNAGSTYVKNLHLNIPEDIDVGDYVLNIEAKNQEGTSYMYGIVLEVNESRHSLDIQDIILRPTSQVEAGRPLGIEVRVENLGSRKEEDIKVVASIKDLGVSTRNYLDELSHIELDSDDDETSGSVMLYLPIPVDAVSGEYDVYVDVEYDRNHEVVTGKTKVYVEGTDVGAADINTIISIDAISKAVNKDEQVVYKFMLANLDDKEAVYSLDVGTQVWGNFALQPGFVRVSPGGAGELNLVLSPKDNAVAGDHTFSVQVRESDEVLRTIDLNANILKAKGVSFKYVLEIGFAILVALLVILGLIIAFKKLGNREEEEPEPIIDNGQSYY